MIRNKLNNIAGVYRSLIPFQTPLTRDFTSGASPRILVAFLPSSLHTLLAPRLPLLALVRYPLGVSSRFSSRVSSARKIVRIRNTASHVESEGRK